jgi:acetyltransferase-like isoleucine patch superfamily enzyme
VKLFLFDDAGADRWRPFALTRPIGEVRFGAFALRERIERWAGIEAAGSLTRPWLARYREAGAPPARPRNDVPAGDLLLVSSRFVPEGGRLATALESAGAGSGAGSGGSGSKSGGGPLVLVCDGAVVGCRLTAGDERPDAAWLADPVELPGGRAVEVPGRRLGGVWQLVEHGPDRLARDVDEIASGGGGSSGGGSSGGADSGAHSGSAGHGKAARSHRATTAPPGVHVLGDGPLVFGADVFIEPGALLDTRAGGIVLGDRTTVRTGARLEGPIAVGPDCKLLGGAYSILSAGPRCGLRGELEETTALGYVNKAHDGFIGHAVIGRWVNLGALTTNSDLKNTYGKIALGGPDGPVETGLIKIGCLLGDHVRTAIGTLLNTGTVVGAGASVFGARMPPKWVPPFAWGAEGEAVSYDLGRFLDTAATVLGRRGVEADEQVRGWWSDCWQRAAGGEG